jgi:hypothetical protein
MRTLRLTWASATGLHAPASTTRRLMEPPVASDDRKSELARVPEAGRADAAHGPPKKGARPDTRHARRRSGLSQPF